MKDKFIEYLDGIKNKAVGEKDTQKLEALKKTYNGDVSPLMKPKSGNSRQAMYGKANSFANIVAPIIETKATATLDTMITTDVKVSNLSHQSFSNLEQLERIANILNDCWENIKRNSELDNISQRIVRDGMIYGYGVSKIFWDQSLKNGIGDVTIERVDPLNFYPEPSATSLDNCNYIFIKRVISRFELIKQYKNKPKIMAIIDKLTEKSREEMSPKQQTASERTVTVTTGDTKQSTSANANQYNPPSNSTQNVTLWECYLKDDTLLTEAPDDKPEEKEVKKKQKMKYPNGRMILYSGEHIIEDRPIDYPFGYPFDIFCPGMQNDLMGIGDAEQLHSIQQKITNAHFTLDEFIYKYKSFLLIDPNVIDPESIDKRFDIIAKKTIGATGSVELVTNKLIEDVKVIYEYIDKLIQDAYRVSRINEMMLSGERPTGVNSGQMVRDLIESPMASIREIQRNFKTYLTGVSNKAISLIQLYYNQPRIVRLSSGNQFAEIAPDEQGNVNQISIVEQDEQTKQLMAIETIQGNLTMGEFEIEITSGSSLPQSKQAIANATMQLAEKGLFGDVNDVKVKELILKNLDFPNYRAIINDQKEKEMEMQQMPQEPDFNNYIPNMSMSLNDITNLISFVPQTAEQTQAVDTILMSLGLKQSAPPTPMPQAPPQNIPEMPSYITSVG